MTRVIDTTSVATHATGNDDGVRCAALQVVSPRARTQEECEQAALALLDDSTQPAWEGEYETWSDLLPGSATDIFPGDGLEVNVPSRGAVFQAIVRAVTIELTDLAGERGRYRLRFANDAADRLGFSVAAARMPNFSQFPAIATTSIGATAVDDLDAAEVTAINSTEITIDAGLAPVSGGGIEVRRSDYGWGPETDRNLVGRFTTRSFTVPRLSGRQTYYLRQFDASAPPRYSRYSAGLHVDYPL